MKITFSINYRTHWGEALFFLPLAPVSGKIKAGTALPMNPKGPDTWEISIDVPAKTGEFDYSFLVRRDNGSCRNEWGKPHRFIPGKSTGNYRIFDSWNDMPDEYPYYSTAFTEGILRRSLPDLPLRPAAGTLRLRVSAPMVRPDEIIAVSGNCDLLGNWNPDQALRMNDAEFPFWNVNIPLGDIKLPLEYKFIIKRNGDPVWEEGGNRTFNIKIDDPKEHIILNGLRFNSRDRSWRGAGTAVPVFSLRSDDDLGCGDFLDLKKMIEWCAATGQCVLQTLPINDTTKTKTWTDSYPYSANSSFALHPMYIRPQAAGTLKDPARRKYFKDKGDRLNQLDKIDYEAVTALKEEYMREIYAECGGKQMKSAEFRSFAETNAAWLRPYAAWRTLRDRFGTPDFSKWEDYATYDDDKIERLFAESPEDTAFFIFEQFHLDKQLKEVRGFAHQNGVILKGDIPIGVGRESVDTWKNPKLFNMDSQAGAPPDDFSVLGQNWGFPTYNWEEMSTDGFRWWKDRFAKMAEYFDAYRIDHILGFFRIWQIPLDAVHGLLGYFNPALPFSPEELRHNYDFWIDPELHTRPDIHEWMLTDFFGSRTDEAKRDFLVPTGPGRYRFKQEFDTQRKISRHFAALKEKTDADSKMEKALLGLADDILFIEDPEQRGHYHPRIAAQHTYQYRMLSDYAKWCFDRLYNDFFYRRHNEFWAGKALWKLPPIIFSTGMLTCAEDLGMIPGCVPEVMERLQILSLEIQRMPKDPDVEFGHTWEYPYNSVCTSSTHDMAGIRGWWENDRETTARYFNNVLHEPGEAPVYAEPWICDRIMTQLLDSPSMLCINPLQDWLSTDKDLRRNDPRDEQINDPANPRHYWRYRMHLTLDDLLHADSFNAAMRERIARSGR